MSEDIKGLIEKINREGVIAAENKAHAIEEAARLKADEIIANARLEAQRLIAEAKISVQKDGERQKDLLVQAGRDMVLVLKGQLLALLDKVIHTEITRAFQAGELNGILRELIENTLKQQNANIEIALSKGDLEKLERGFIAKLQEQMKKGLVLRSTDDIRAGFTISFDSGKSQFDFSDTALTEYISVYLKPKLKEILQK